MKKFLCITLVIFISLSAMSQNEQQKEAEVRVMELREAEALLEKDIPALREIWSPGFMVNAPLNAVFIGGQVEMVQAGIIEYTSFSRNIEHVMVLKDVVITMGSETAVPAGMDPMAGQTVVRRYTNIWMKQQGKWILMARHANNICPPPTPSAAAPGNRDQLATTEITGLVRNNPSRNSFQLDLSKLQNDKIFITISDIQGRVVERMQLPMHGQTVTLGDHYGRGVYFAEISNGFTRNTVKLVKL